MMKLLLNGVAIAAALAIAAPVWAQAPSTSSSVPGQPSRTSGMPKGGHPSASTGTPISKEQKASMVHKRMTRRHAAPSMADQLNRQELAREQAGMPAPTGTGMYGQPSSTRGIPKAGTPSPSPPSN